MQLLINGKPHQVENPLSLHHLLTELGYEPKSIAVALNGRFIPRHQYISCLLEDAQELEVVAPMQGG
jgi:sulfur carrier protein